MELLLICMDSSSFLFENRAKREGSCGAVEQGAPGDVLCVVNSPLEISKGFCSSGKCRLQAVPASFVHTWCNAGVAFSRSPGGTALLPRATGAQLGGKSWEEALRISRGLCLLLPKAGMGAQLQKPAAWPGRAGQPGLGLAPHRGAAHLATAGAAQLWLKNRCAALARRCCG